MKRIAVFTSVIVLAIVFVACKQNKPEPVVEKFYTHLGRGEFKEIKEYVMEEHRSYYELLESLVASQGGDTEEKPQVKVTDIKCEIQDDVATCSCLVQIGDKTPEEQMLQLKKVDKNWLVNQGKESSMPASDDDNEVEFLEELASEEMAGIE